LSRKSIKLQAIVKTLPTSRAVNLWRIIVVLKIQDIESNWSSQVQALCYIVSQWDREYWQDYLKAFPYAQASVDAGSQKIKGWELFAEEVFHRLFTMPQAIPYDQLRPEVLWAHQLHRLIDESVDFSEMQMNCRNNKLAAGAGTYRLIEMAMDALPKPPRGFESPATMEEWGEKYVEIQAQITAFQEVRNRLMGELQSETDLDRQQGLQQQLKQIAFDISELQAQLGEVKKQIGNANQIFEDYANQLGLAIADSLTAAIRESMLSVRTFLLSMNAFGWGEGMGMLNIPGNAAAKEALALRLSQDDRLRAIAEAAGRFQAIAALRQGAKRSKHIPDEISDTSLGNNLSRLVPSEWVRVAVEELRSLFLKDYADESLAQTEFDGAVDEGQQGPIVICLDKSDSMTWDGGKKEIDSTALMLALVSIAQEQGRKCRVILFDDPVRYVKDLDPNTASHADRIDLADRQYAGGTNFMAPLSKALEAIEGSSDLRDADVIFITDGEAEVTGSFSRTWREAQTRLGFKVFTLIVGAYVNPEILDSFSDRNIFVEDLDDPNTHQVFDI
jgi:uncharacterized protein with von Willebrand factor type A (vWA) domain